MKDNSHSGAILILLAGVFWGSMGIFVRRLGALGFDSIQISAARLLLAALLFLLLLLIREPRGLRIRGKDIPLFLGLGLGSILFFTVCYFSAITIMSLSTAAILLYTSPIWVMLMSALFFRERIGRTQLLALLMAFGGCVLVSGLGGGGFSGRGLLLGLGSGLGYGLYSILGTVALRRYSPYTVTFYTFAVAGLGALAICRPAALAATAAAAPSPLSVLLLFLLMALVTAVIPFLSYTLGLRSVAASRAAILATVEPVVATLFGVLLFSEPMTLSAGLGILLVLGAVFLLNRRSAEKT